MEQFDLLIVGGGINGAGVARDAAGRGLSVALAEKDDLAAHTSSASTKLIHGGLRYLRTFEFRLVRESLRERERLLRIAPHLVRPLEFVIPPQAAGPPGFLLRAGLFLYDRLGGRQTLPRTRTVDLAHHSVGSGLRNPAGRAFVYSDCWVDDSRLVVLNARDAADRGAQIWTRTELVNAMREGGHWRVTLRTTAGERQVRARAVVNAAGPWAGELPSRLEGARARHPVRLVKGSHIVLPRLFEGEQAYLITVTDGRVVFAIPFLGDFTLVGTTDTPWRGPPARPAIDAEETDYLLTAINEVFARKVSKDDIVWSFSGLRALHDDGAERASQVTRDYVLDLDLSGPALLNIIGGKLTTYRRLAEKVLEKLAPLFPGMRGRWTDDAPLPGGDLPHGLQAALAKWQQRYPELPTPLLRRLGTAYGDQVPAVLGDARKVLDLGECFTGNLFAREVNYLVEREWAQTAEDILFRRSKLGVRATAAEVERLDRYVRARRA